MNQIAKIEERIDKQLTASMSIEGGGITFRNASEVMEYAKMMAVSGSAVPKHLRGEPGACLGVLDDAIRFGFSPYALARKSYFVNDNLAYEAQVLAAVVLARAPLRERPDIVHHGDGQSRRCKVTFRFVGGEERVYESPPVSQITPKNSPLWKSDPDQQLAYYSMRAASRRHCPEVLLGVYDVEEVAAAHARDVTPQRPEFIQRLQGKAQAEGFSAANVERETSNQLEAPASDKPAADSEASDPVANAADAGPAESSPPAQPITGTSSPEIASGKSSHVAGDTEARGEAQAQPPTEASAPPSNILRQYWNAINADGIHGPRDVARASNKFFDKNIATEAQRQQTMRLRTIRDNVLAGAYSRQEGEEKAREVIGP